MRTQFFGIMLAASSAALTLADNPIIIIPDPLELNQSETDLELLFDDYDPEPSFVAQTTSAALASIVRSKDTGTQWRNHTGLVKTTFLIPEKNCCVFYTERDFKGWRTEPLCFDEKTNDPVTRWITSEIKSMDCGAETFANISKRRDENEKFSGTAGRVQVSKSVGGVYNENKTWVRVGHYDMKKKPAILIFPDENCELMPKRFYWNPEDDNGSQYNEADLKLQEFNTDYNLKYAMAVQVPPGYTATLYPKKNWQGKAMLANGQFHEDALTQSGNPEKPKTEGSSPGVEALQCQKLPKNEVRSLRIDKIAEKKAIAYWKGITASSPQKFTYTVGIGSGTSDKSTDDKVEQITKAMEGGVTASIKGKAGFNWFGLGGSVEAEVKSETKFGGKNKSETRSMEEISSTGTSNHSVTFTTTCSIDAKPEDIAKDKTLGGVGLWQYVISTEDLSAAAFTPHTVCRRGKLALTPPKCPYYACLDDQCETCNEKEIESKGIEQYDEKPEKFPLTHKIPELV